MNTGKNKPKHWQDNIKLNNITSGEPSGKTER